MLQENKEEVPAIHHPSGNAMRSQENEEEAHLMHLLISISIY
jgi:hypothetical protein